MNESINKVKNRVPQAHWLHCKWSVASWGQQLVYWLAQAQNISILTESSVGHCSGIFSSLFFCDLSFSSDDSNSGSEQSFSTSVPLTLLSGTVLCIAGHQVAPLDATSGSPIQQLKLSLDISNCPQGEKNYSQSGAIGLGYVVLLCFNERTGETKRDRHN